MIRRNSRAVANITASVARIVIDVIGNRSCFAASRALSITCAIPNMGIKSYRAANITSGVADFGVINVRICRSVSTADITCGVAFVVIYVRL